MIVWHQPQLSPRAIICDRENSTLLNLKGNTMHTVKLLSTVQCTLVYLCCQQQWSPGCSRGGAWWSGKFQLHETRSAPHERRRSSQRRLLLSTSPSTPPRSGLYRWSPAALWYEPLSSGRTAADLQNQWENKAESWNKNKWNLNSDIKKIIIINNDKSTNYSHFKT